MLEIREKEHEAMVTIPVEMLVELIDARTRLDMFYQIINSEAIYAKDDLLKLLKKKSPAADQSKQGLENNNFD